MAELLTDCSQRFKEIELSQQLLQAVQLGVADQEALELLLLWFWHEHHYPRDAGQ